MRATLLKVKSVFLFFQLTDHIWVVPLVEENTRHGPCVQSAFSPRIQIQVSLRMWARGIQMEYPSAS